MRESWHAKDGLRSISGIVLAAVGGAVVTVLILILFYRAGGLPSVASPVVLTGNDLQLVSGQGEKTPAGLEVRQPGPQELTIVRGSSRMARAALYRRLFWQVDGLDPGQELRLIWTTFAEPGTVQELVLPSVGPEGGALDLGAEPRWQDRIAVVGLALSGSLRQPLVIRRLELQPLVPTVTELLGWAVDEWTTFEDWNQRSINYAAGAPPNALFPPVLVVALWIGFSVSLYAAFGSSRRAVEQRWPYVALFLVGWLALDLRWEWDLSRRLAQTEARFAGKEGDERRLADLDGDLYRFLLEVRRRLPERPCRLFVVSSDPGGYWAGRARYHLLPHNGFMGFSQPPTANAAREGDYVLILSPLAGVRYDHERKMLEWTKGQLPAEMLHASARGVLLRVLGG
ncbi:MAG TPA: hypothetical protein PKY50_04200 [Candidatus Competibacter sp.]|nr:hypothetical protein [Candidatus Competibacter sp.]